jgi:hypothetical protein
MGKIINAFRILARKRKEREHLLRTTNNMRGQKDYIRMGLTCIEYEGVDWIEMVYDVVQWRSLVNTVMNLGEIT